MKRIRYKLDRDATEDSDTFDESRHELTLAFSLREGERVFHKKVKIDARHLRGLALTTAEKWLLEQNTRPMLLRFPQFRQITWHDYAALAKQWRYESLQQELFEWHNAEQPDAQEPGVAAFAAQLPLFTSHCVRCLEKRAAEEAELAFLPAECYANEQVAAGGQVCGECGRSVAVVYSY